MAEQAELGVWRIARADPEACAIVDVDGRSIDYGELAGLTNGYVHGLRAAGMQTGDVLAVALPNGAEALALYLAALQAGWYYVPINWHLVGAEMSYILTDSAAKAFVCHQRFAAAGAEAAQAAGLPATARYCVGAVPGFTPLSELLRDQSRDAPAARTAGAPMQYTSGTTGRPKGVRRALTGSSPDQVAAAGAGFLGLFGLRPFDGNVHICGSPLYHTAVLFFASAAVQIGHPVVLMDRWEAEQMLRLIERHRVTHSHMVPTQLRRLLALPEWTRAAHDVSSLRAVVHGAAPCPAEVKRAMIDWWGPVLIDYYAATEGGGTLITSAEWLRRPGSVGRPWPGSAVRICDDEGRELAAGEVGTVYLRMGGSDFAYHGDEAKTRAARLAGHFTVGDVGYLDSGGYLYLCDRKSDMIISGGVNIYPAEIEAELVVHPKVDDVAVFGIPHPDWGEQIKAVVQPAVGVQLGEALTAELLAYAAGRLAKFKLPRSIDYVTELPRDPNGKLYKRRLRDPYWAGNGRAI